MPFSLLIINGNTVYNVNYEINHENFDAFIVTDFENNDVTHVN